MSQWSCEWNLGDLKSKKARVRDEGDMPMNTLHCHCSGTTRILLCDSALYLVLHDRTAPIAGQHGAECNTERCEVKRLDYQDRLHRGGLTDVSRSTTSIRDQEKQVTNLDPRIKFAPDSDEKAKRIWRPQ